MIALGSIACGGIQVNAGVGERCDAERTCTPPAVCGTDGICHDLSVGCADGARDGFLDVARYPDIAACAGGWTIPGLAADIDHPETTIPQCGRRSGDDQPGWVGLTCSAADICAQGWRVCLDVADATSHGLPSTAQTDDGPHPDCKDAWPDEGGGWTWVFYATRQRAKNEGELRCDLPQGYDNVFGCGNLGNNHIFRGCAPFNTLNVRPNDPDTDCGAANHAPWDCGTDRRNELRNVVKWGPQGGGVLCCRE